MEQAVLRRGGWGRGGGAALGRHPQSPQPGADIPSFFASLGLTDYSQVDIPKVLDQVHHYHFIECSY